MASKKPSERYATHPIGGSNHPTESIGDNDFVIFESVNTSAYTSQDEIVRVGRSRDIIEDYFGRITGKNLYNKDTTTTNKYINGTGNLASSGSDTFNLSDWIPVTAGDVLKYTAFTVIADAYVAFYSEKTMPTGEVDMGGGVTRITLTNLLAGNAPATAPMELTVPTGAKWLRTSVNKAQKNTLQIEVIANSGDPSTTFEAYYLHVDPARIEPLHTANIADGAITLDKLDAATKPTAGIETYFGTDTSKNLFDKTAVNYGGGTSSYINASGVLSKTTIWDCVASGYILVTAGDKLMINLVKRDAYSAGMYTAFYDESGAFISGSSINNDLITAGYVLTAPTGAVSMRTTISKTLVDSVRIEVISSDNTLMSAPTSYAKGIKTDKIVNQSEVLQSKVETSLDSNESLSAINGNITSGTLSTGAKISIPMPSSCGDPVNISFEYKTTQKMHTSTGTDNILMSICSGTSRRIKLILRHKLPSIGLFGSAHQSRFVVKPLNSSGVVSEHIYGEHTDEADEKGYYTNNLGRWHENQFCGLDLFSIRKRVPAGDANVCTLVINDTQFILTSNGTAVVTLTLADYAAYTVHDFLQYLLTSHSTYFGTGEDVKDYIITEYGSKCSDYLVPDIEPINALLTASREHTNSTPYDDAWPVFVSAKDESWNKIDIRIWTAISTTSKTYYSLHINNQLVVPPQQWLYVYPLQPDPLTLWFNHSADETDTEDGEMALIRNVVVERTTEQLKFNRFAVVCMHVVTDAADGDVGSVPSTMSTGRFLYILDCIKKYGWELIGLPEFEDMVSGNRPWRDKVCLFTNDDGVFAADGHAITKNAMDLYGVKHGYGLILNNFNFERLGMPEKLKLLYDRGDRLCYHGYFHTVVKTASYELWSADIANMISTMEAAGYTATTHIYPGGSWTPWSVRLQRTFGIRVGLLATGGTVGKFGGNPYYMPRLRLDDGEAVSTATVKATFDI